MGNLIFLYLRMVISIFLHNVISTNSTGYVCFNLNMCSLSIILNVHANIFAMDIT